ncbi:MAG: gliding motility-associated C-terminal domain-containing protein [Williamsia sp.]|nr:gliding motility-associated C-terminal domain-containing protein [Williamsia sp.]
MERDCCIVLIRVLLIPVLAIFAIKGFGQDNKNTAVAYSREVSHKRPVNPLQSSSGMGRLNKATSAEAQGAQSQLSCNDWLFVPSVPSCVNVGDLDVTGTQVTVEAVINRTAPYVGVDLYAGDVVSKHTSPADANYLLRPSSAEITTTNGYFKTPVICAVELNKTYHIALVYDGTVLKFYRNGFLMSQIAASGNLFQNNLSTLIGHYSGTLSNEGFVGYINEVRIWNVARTQDEIRAYMSSSLPASPQAGLLAYYVFNDLQNKQGNATWNGKLNSNAQINQSNPACSSFVIDSCGLAPVCRIQSLNILDSLAACRTVSFRTQAIATAGTVSSYQWSFGDGVAATGQPASHTFRAPGTYTVKLVVSSSAGCRDSITKPIAVSSIAASAGSDTVVCRNQSVALRGSSGASSYSWSPGKLLNDSTVQSPVATVQNSTRFFLTVKSALGCTDTSSVFIAVRPKTVFNAASSYKVCKGEPVTFSVQHADEAVWSPATYLSSATAIDPVCKPASSIQYTARVQEHVCHTDSTIVVSVTVNELPVITASKSNDIDCSHFSTRLNATGASAYRWSPATGLNDTTLRNPTATIGTSTTYTVKGTDTAGCTASATVEVGVSRTGAAVYALPNAFTPNGDGRNDCFGITQWQGLTKVEFSIFNRYGQRIYYSTSPSACWDGRYRGEVQDAGGYVYMIKAVSACATNIFKKGTVLLVK